MDDKTKFEIFKDACQFWIKKLFMEDYCYDFVLVDDLESACAGASYVLPAHHAYMQLADDEDDPDTIRAAALHEVLEILLMPMKLQAINTGDVEHYSVQRETHAVINRLERMLRDGTGHIRSIQ